MEFTQKRRMGLDSRRIVNTSMRRSVYMMMMIIIIIIILHDHHNHNHTTSWRTANSFMRWLVHPCFYHRVHPQCLCNCRHQGHLHRRGHHHLPHFRYSRQNTRPSVARPTAPNARQAIKPNAQPGCMNF